MNLNDKRAGDQRIQDLISKKQFDEASTLIRGKFTRDPDDADAFYLQGILHYFRGEIGPTVENLRKALSIEPRHTDAAICLSVLFNDIGKYDEAKGVFEQANQSVAHKHTGDDVDIDRKFAVKHLEIADLYFRYRRYEEAIEEYRKAILLDTSLLDVRIRLAKAHAKRGMVTRAMQELQELKNEHSHYMPARIQLGLLHYSQGNVLDAELEWESVMDLDHSNREAKAYLEMARQARLKR